MIERVRKLGTRSINALWRAGSMARFFMLILSNSAMSFRRFQLTIREVYFAGVMSLVRIMVSGWVNGMVLGVCELLAETREQIAAVIGAIGAQQQFWLADAQLSSPLIGTP